MTMDIASSIVSPMMLLLPIVNGGVDGLTDEVCRTNGNLATSVEIANHALGFSLKLMQTISLKRRFDNHANHVLIKP